MSQKRRISLAQAAAMQAPLDGQYDLEQLIAKAKREEAERARLAAPPQAKAKHTNLAQQGKLGANQKLGEIAQQLSAALDKKRRTQGRKNAAVQYNGPTPERAAKAHDGVVSATVIPGQGPVPPVKLHQVQSPIDRYGEFWDPSMSHGGRDLLQAARDLRDIFLLAASTPRITSSYEGTPSTKTGARSGGVADYLREAANLADIIRARFPACIADIEMFLAEVVHHQDGSPVKFQDSGALISPWKSPEAQKGAGYGALYRTLQVLEWFMAEAREQGWGWGARTADAEIRRALAKEVKARADILRDKQAWNEREAISDYVEAEQSTNAKDIFVGRALRAVAKATAQVMREKQGKSDEREDSRRQPQKGGR